MSSCQFIRWWLVDRFTIQSTDDGFHEYYQCIFPHPVSYSFAGFPRLFPGLCDFNPLCWSQCTETPVILFFVVCRTIFHPSIYAAFTNPLAFVPHPFSSSSFPFALLVLYFTLYQTRRGGDQFGSAGLKLKTNNKGEVASHMESSLNARWFWLTGWRRIERLGMDTGAMMTQETSELLACSAVQ